MRHVFNLVCHNTQGDEFLDLSPRQATDARANLAGNRARDAERSNNSSDSTATISGRNAREREDLLNKKLSTELFTI